MAAQSQPVDMKLEVVVIGVTDVDRALAFYKNLGWRLDGDCGTKRRSIAGPNSLRKPVKSSSIRSSYLQRSS